MRLQLNIGDGFCARGHEVHFFLVYSLTLNVILTASLLADGLCGPVKSMSLTKNGVHAFLLSTVFLDC